MWVTPWDIMQLMIRRKAFDEGDGRSAAEKSLDEDTVKERQRKQGNEERSGENSERVRRKSEREREEKEREKKEERKKKVEEGRDNNREEAEELLKRERAEQSAASSQKYNMVFGLISGIVAVVIVSVSAFFWFIVPSQQSASIYDI